MVVLGLPVLRSGRRFSDEVLSSPMRGIITPLFSTVLVVNYDTTTGSKRRRQSSGVAFRLDEVSDEPMVGEPPPPPTPFNALFVSSGVIFRRPTASYIILNCPFVEISFHKNDGMLVAEKQRRDAPPR